MDDLNSTANEVQVREGRKTKRPPNLFVIVIVVNVCPRYTEKKNMDENLKNLGS